MYYVDQFYETFSCQEKMENGNPEHFSEKTLRFASLTVFSCSWPLLLGQRLNNWSHSSEVCYSAIWVWDIQ